MKIMTNKGVELKKTFGILAGSMAMVPQMGLAQSVASQNQRLPNVVYVFPDQFRNFAMGFWGRPEYMNKLRTVGDPVHTPNIDRFAGESVVLSSAMSNCPLSSPHRGSLMTGMYPNKSGVPLNCNSSRPFSSLRDDAKCLSDVLSEAGYDCAYIGKLHAQTPLRNDPDRPGQYVEDRVPAWDAYTPASQRHGFNYWYSYGTFDVHKNPHYWDTDGKKHEPKEWSPIHEAKKAASYIKNEGNVRDSSKPFFIMVGMNPPHSPYRSLDDCMPEDYALYKDKPIDQLLVRPNANAKMEKAGSVRYYFASVTGVDRAFGMILQAIKDAGLERNTIVVFSSDHGETMCSQNTDDPKNSPYAEAMNVPFIVRYPGKLTPRVDNLLLSSPDIMPTLLGMAGLKGNIPAEVQGTDYSRLFFDKNAKIKRPEGALYIQNVDGDKNAEGKVINYFAKARGIKTADYTLAFYVNRKNQLQEVRFFDDKNDPYQMHNLAMEKHPKTVKKLCAQLGKLLRKIDDPWYQRRVLPQLIKY